MHGVTHLESLPARAASGSVPARVDRRRACGWQRRQVGSTCVTRAAPGAGLPHIDLPALGKIALPGGLAVHGQLPTARLDTPHPLVAMISSQRSKPPSPVRRVQASAPGPAAISSEGGEPASSRGRAQWHVRCSAPSPLEFTRISQGGALSVRLSLPREPSTSTLGSRGRGSCLSPSYKM